MPQLFDDLAAYLRGQGNAASRRRAAQAACAQGSLREEQGYGLEELLRELEIMRRAVLGGPVATFVRAHGLTQADAERAHGMVGRFFEDCTAASAGQYIQGWSSRLEAVDASRVLLGGEVRVRSAVGHGSWFALELPMVPKPSVSAAELRLATGLFWVGL